MVLNGLNPVIEKGEIVAVINRFGCGKTVLLDYILDTLVSKLGHARVADNEMDGAPLVDIASFEGAIVLTRRSLTLILPPVIWEFHEWGPPALFGCMPKSLVITCTLSMELDDLFYDEPTTDLGPKAPPH